MKDTDKLSPWFIELSTHCSAVFRPLHQTDAEPLKYMFKICDQSVNFIRSLSMFAIFSLLFLAQLKLP